MAKRLEVDRNTCQRIVAATATGQMDATVLVQLPGVLGLRQFVDAMAREFTTAEQTELIGSCRAAIDAVESLLRTLGCSQRRLRERLEADPRSAPAEVAARNDGVSSRKSLFRAATEITGRCSEVRCSLSAIRPVPGDPTRTEYIKAGGYAGHVAFPGAMPLELGEQAAEHLQTERASKSFEPLSAECDAISDESNRYLLSAFCSQPLPRVTSRRIGTRIVHVIESGPSPEDERRAMDIFVAERHARPDKHPATQRPALGEVWSMITFPARRLIFDVYLHREIARRCIPSLEVHLWNSSAGQQGLWRWSTRFPKGPRLTLLGAGLSNADAEGLSSHAPLTAHVFDRAGWDASEFVGYRCDVEYPIWRAGYCMLFDFTGNELPTDGDAARAGA